MKNYLIIGASSGIGAAIAQQLVEKGHQIIGTYNETEKSGTSNISYHQLDVTTDLTLDFLPDHLDGIVYCPGSINLMPFKRIKPQAFVDDFQLQVIGAIKVIQSALTKLKKGTHPSIVLFSTVAVQTGFNFHTQVAVSKGAIEGLCKSLAAELAPAIRVNAIAPSLTDTPLAEKMLNSDQKREANAQRHPLKRIGTADDIAAMATFLLSEEAGWITGQVMHVDGGMSVIRA